MTKATEYAARLDALAAAVVRAQEDAKQYGGQRGGLLRQKVVGLATAYGIMTDIEDYPEALSEAVAIGQLLVETEGDE